jgi:hypothetical protein
MFEPKYVGIFALIVYTSQMRYVIYVPRYATYILVIKYILIVKKKVVFQR